MGFKQSSPVFSHVQSCAVQQHFGHRQPACVAVAPEVGVELSFP